MYATGADRTRVRARVSLLVRAKSHVVRTGDARKRRLGDVFQFGVAREKGLNVLLLNHNARGRVAGG